MHSSVRRVVFSPVAALVWVLVSSGQVLAQADAITEEGLFVTVQNPITTDVVSRIKSQVGQRRLSEARAIRKVVFDFNPDGKDASTADFGSCRDLAHFIKHDLSTVQTIAFVHAKVSGHTVLPVLACKELVMGKEARIGEVAAETVAPLTDPDKAAYKFYFNRDPQFAIVQKMYDRDVELTRAVRQQDGAVWHIDRRNEAEAKKQGLVGFEPVKFTQPGQLGLYSAAQAIQLGLCKATAESRTEVASLYGISPSSIRDDPLQGRAPDAYRYTLKGEVDGAMRESLNRIIRDVHRKKGNTLILTIACSGGDLGVARQLADDLVKAQTGEDALLVIGFIPEQAADSAVFVAMGCTDIVMSRRRDAQDGIGGEAPKEAEIGDFEGVIKGGKPGTVDAHRKSLKELAEQQGYPGILVDGMFDRDLEIVRVRGAKDRTQQRLMSRAEYDAAKADWNLDGTVKSKGQLLKLNATRASELGLARFVVDNRDPAEVYALYGLDPARVKEVSPGWLDRFAEFLRMPVVTVLLVVIGFTGLILELKVPGLTVPGIIAALCFILVFWANSRFSGETFVLALLLFIMGLVLIGLEIFVLPGFGAPGIVGILCMLAGLGLVTIDRVPQSGAEWGDLGVKVSQYMFGMIGALGLAFLIARFLPKVPYANRLLLVPPGEKADDVESALPGAGEAASLLGAIGTTNTALRPAGVVRFGDKFVDVVSDGGFIPAGTRVQVIAVEGTRIVVKEV